MRVHTPTLFAAALLIVPCYGQNNANFTAVNTPTSGPPSRNSYAVDVNDDGIPDIVMDSLQLPNSFSVFIANSDGTFNPGYSFTFPNEYQGTVPMVSGDFNGDGNVDLIFKFAGTNQIAVFLGNGDGTFQPPMYEIITLPSGQQWFGGLPIVTADFTGDGNLDLVTESNGNTASAIVLIPGDGTGQFSTSTTFYTPPANHGVGTDLGIGDFDGDGKADVAFLDTYNCGTINCSSNLYIGFGNGTGSFDINGVLGGLNNFRFATGELNNDAHTDIFGFSSSSGEADLIIVYVMSNRQFPIDVLPAGVFGPVTRPTMADFNGDGMMDIAAISQDLSGNSSLQLYLGGSRIPFTPFRLETISIQGIGVPVIGDFNRDSKPDIAYVVSSATGNSPPPNIVAALNTTTDGTFINCAFPSSGVGINVCSPPSSTTSPAHFLITANSFGQLRKLEIWVDGTKVGERWNTWGQRAWFDMSNSFSTGTHSATVYAADVDNRLQRYDFSFTVVTRGLCTAPSSPGVSVCSPANGTYVPSPVTVSAAANIVGNLDRMEIWVDGAKYYSENTSTSFITSLALPDGNHQFDIYAINTDGTKYETTVFTTVSSCSAASSPGVSVYSPANCSDAPAPVTLTADANTPPVGNLDRMEIWVDGVKYETETTDTSLFAPFGFDLSDGYHQFDIYAVSTDGTKYETTVLATVGSTISCPADPGYGVRVCTPLSSTTVSSPVLTVARAHITGTLARMEVWVDGVKKFTETRNLTLSTSIALPSGLHQFDFYAVDTTETKWETTVFATVP
jgi:hypothetical protein